MIFHGSSCTSPADPQMLRRRHRMRESQGQSAGSLEGTIGVEQEQKRLPHLRCRSPTHSLAPHRRSNLYCEYVEWRGDGRLCNASRAFYLGLGLFLKKKSCNQNLYVDPPEPLKGCENTAKKKQKAKQHLGSRTYQS